MAKKKDDNEILTVPCCLVGVKYKKAQDNWDVTFEVDPVNLEKLKPLMAHMQEYFELLLIKMDEDELDKLSKDNDADSIEL